MTCYGSYSDHLAVVAAFDQWREAKKNGQQAALHSVLRILLQSHC